MEKDISRKNEIVTIFNHLRLKHIAVNIKNRDNQRIISGFVTKSDSDYVSIFFDSIPDVLPVKNLSLAFEYNRNFYSSSPINLRLLNVPLKSIDVMMPELLSHHLLRKYTRVDMSGDIMRMYIKRLDTPSSEAASKVNIDELPPTLKGLYMELTQEEPDIKRIAEMIGQELGRFSNRFKTNIFKGDTNLTPLEKVVATYKKTFWIGDTDNLNNYVHLGDKYNIIGYEKYFELIKKTLSPDVLEQIRDNYVGRGISSYCMVPVLIGDRVAGVIEVSVPANSPEFKKLSIYDIFYIKGLADIMGEVVVKTKSADMSQEETFSVINFSMGGILASTKNIYLTRSFRENSVVILTLVLDSKEIDVSARVVRYDYIPGENAGLNVAFEFLNLSEDSKAEIGKFIRKFLRISVKDDASGS